MIRCRGIGGICSRSLVRFSALTMNDPVGTREGRRRQKPGYTRHRAFPAGAQALMELAHWKAHDDYGTLKEAAAVYIEAQFELVFAVRAAYDDGVPVTELHTSWLNVAAGQAVIETRNCVRPAGCQAGRIGLEPGHLPVP